jgi:Zn-dependent protease
MDTIFYLIILIMSVVIHEISHGFTARYFGDHTAYFAGRLTLNPIRHLDLFGSVLLPALLVLTHSPFLIGWAKPVPYNPDNLRNKRWGELAVAAAGVLANIFLAVFFGLILRFSPSLPVPAGFSFIISSIVLVNLALALFNLVPIPPLDGSKILFNLLPVASRPFLEKFERYSLYLIIIFILFFSSYLFPALAFLYRLITGISL